MNFNKLYYGLGLAAILLICSSSDIKEELKFHVVIDNDFNALFTTKHGWTGADIANAIPLSDSLTLWLFGGTWIGKIKNNKHINSTIISNAVAIQYGKIASKKNLKFYYRKERGKPQIENPFDDPDKWSWKI
jgi:hypothetical protein